MKYNLYTLLSILPQHPMQLFQVFIYINNVTSTVMSLLPDCAQFLFNINILLIVLFAMYVCATCRSALDDKKLENTQLNKK